MFVDVVLKAVGVQLIYAAVVVFGSSLVTRIARRKEKHNEQ